MPRGPSPDAAATFVGVVSTVAGVALVLVPAKAGPVLGVGDDRLVTTAVGIADAVVGRGLLRGDRRRWMVARVAVNAAVAARCVSLVRREGPAPGAVRGAAAMGLLSAADLSVIRGLSRS